MAEDRMRRNMKFKHSFSFIVHTNSFELSTALVTKALFTKYGPYFYVHMLDKDRKGMNGTNQYDSFR